MDTVYSQKFREIINDSPKQAARHNNRYVMPEHLLLSLLSDMEGEPARLIDRGAKGASAYELRENLDKATRSTPPTCSLPYSTTPTHRTRNS